LIRKKILFASLALSAFVASSLPSKISELAEILINAHKENRFIPVLSDRYPELDVESAYLVQKSYVQRRLENDRTAGFKAGLTSETTQKRFGVNFSVLGVLLSSGKKVSGSIIESSSFKLPIIETEVGFVVEKTISHPLKDVSELRDHIHSIMPVVELPDLGFQDLKNVKAVDIIASNVSASEFIVGQENELKKTDLDKTTVTLTRDGKVVNQGKGSDTLGGQWKTALWLVNAVVKQGWKIEPGQILITGALGTMIPAKKGRYVADYESLGKVWFEVK